MAVAGGGLGTDGTPPFPSPPMVRLCRDFLPPMYLGRFTYRYMAAWRGGAIARKGVSSASGLFRRRAWPDTADQARPTQHNTSNNNKNKKKNSSSNNDRNGSNLFPSGCNNFSTRREPLRL